MKLKQLGIIVCAWLLTASVTLTLVACSFHAGVNP